MEKIKIKTEFIKADNFLKYAGIAVTGGEAKLMIEQGIVSADKEVIFQRGKKLYPGTLVEIDTGEQSAAFLIEKE